MPICSMERTDWERKPLPGCLLKRSSVQGRISRAADVRPAKMEHGTHPDFQMIVGEKKNSIHIDSVRKIRQDCVVKPNDGSVKVYLIANIQDMTEEAFNAFLKTR